MIAKEITLKALRKDNFGRLAEYLTDTQSNDLRVGQVRVTNCKALEFQDAVKEILLTQEKNHRSKRCKTLHVLLSYHSEDNLTTEQLKQIEDEFCKKIGMDKHQRISVVHGDTDHPHIHIAINKIDPETGRNVDPYHLWKVMADAVADIEKQFGLRQDNHRSAKTRSQNIIDTAERMSGEETLCSKIRKIDTLKNARTWKEYLQICQDNQIAVKKRGNGLIFTDGTYSVKASTVDRKFSLKNLEKSFGNFPDATTPEADPLNQELGRTAKIKANDNYKRLWDEYLKSKENSDYKNRKEKFWQAKREYLNELYANSKKDFETIRTSMLSPSMKKMLYNKLKARISEERQALTIAVKFKNRQIAEQSTWRGFLHSKAKQGDPDAIAILESQQQRKISIALQKKITQRLESALKPVYITKNGTRIYRTSNHFIRVSPAGVLIQDVKKKINWKGFRKIGNPELQILDSGISEYIKKKEKKMKMIRRKQMISRIINAIKKASLVMLGKHQVENKEKIQKKRSRSI